MSERQDLRRSDGQFGQLPVKSPGQQKVPMGPGPFGRGPGGPMGMGMTGEKARNFKNSIKMLIRYLSPYKYSMISMLILSVLGTIFMIIGPKLMGDVTTKLYEGVMAKIAHIQGAGIDFYYIGKMVFILTCLYIIAAICTYLQGLLMSNVSVKATYQLRREISEKISRLPLKYFDTSSHGDILSRITNDVDTISNTLNQGLSQIVSSVTTIIGIIIMMAYISVLMTLVTLLMLPISFSLVSFLIKKSQKLYKRQRDYLGSVNGHVEEMYSGHNVMRVFNGEKKSIEKFDELNEELYKAGWKSQFFSSLMMPVTMFVGNVGYVVICILGGYLTIIKAIQIGDIQAFIQYVRIFNMPISQTANIANIMQSTAAAAERVFEFLEEEEERMDVLNPIKPERIAGRVSFKNVNFGYSPDKIIINDFSVDIKAGQKVAIVGPTGAGKTTMVKLLMRFYDINSGSIMLDGIDIREFNRKDLRGNFGMVLQDAWLFNGTIKENIRYGNIEATDEEIVNAAKIANVDHVIHYLPNGYDMELNEDADNVSQGEKQLLTIARAVLADPRILILDEATSSVDTMTEILIQRAVERLMKGRTSFIIAHRLSTIRNADIILVMKDGAIVEQGSHKELLGSKGLYASMYYSQFEGRN
ncbi:MAG TPA: ABC transporter ATP-binding protein [Desulfatiglandales bacterium]|nr:ABC transporter ATP-binding protein [Desulfatiglandales bacterium]